MSAGSRTRCLSAPALSVVPCSGLLTTEARRKALRRRPDAVEDAGACSGASGVAGMKGGTASGAAAYIM